jgi:hypothetical protein
MQNFDIINSAWHRAVALRPGGDRASVLRALANIELTHGHEAAAENLGRLAEGLSEVSA